MTPYKKTILIQEIDENGVLRVVGSMEVEAPTLEELQAEADKKLLEAFDEVERLRNIEE
jgi:hypothetical protein